MLKQQILAPFSSLISEWHIGIFSKNKSWCLILTTILASEEQYNLAI